MSTENIAEQLEDVLFRDAKAESETNRAKICDYVSSTVADGIVELLVKESVKYGHELYWPTLSFLHSLRANAGVSTTQISDLSINVLEQHWLSAVRARNSALCLAIKRIANFANKVGGVLHGVKILDGDSHNGGHRPVVFGLMFIEKYVEYVYKPVTAGTHKIFQVVGSLVDDNSDAGIHGTSVEYDGGDFFIRKFIKQDGCFDDDGVTSYFFKFGVICSIAMILEMYDLHFENIISSIFGPVIVDTESMLPPPQLAKRKWSLVTSGLFAPDISPLNQHSKYRKIGASLERHEKNYRFRYSNPETYDLHVIRKVSTGRLFDTKDYSTSFKRGAVHGFSCIMKSKDDILALCKPHLDKTFRARQILRNTSLYRILQLRLWTPIPFKFDDRLAVVERALQRKATQHLAGQLDNKTASILIEREMAALLKGDIPYFWIDSDNFLHDSTGPLGKRFGSTSAYERLRRRLGVFSLRSPSFEADRLFSLAVRS